MTNAELDTLWSRAEQFSGGFTRYRFAALVAAAERNRMIADGWRQCAQGQRTTQFCAVAEQEREHFNREREQYARWFDETADDIAKDYKTRAAAIRARNNT
jgi:hypothetical protein